MSANIRPLGDAQQEVMDYNKEKKESCLRLASLTESQHHLMDYLSGFTICESRSLGYNAVAGICVFQCLIRTVWVVHLHSENCAVQLLLQFYYP